jgi:RNase P subunit RPR2
LLYLELIKKKKESKADATRMARTLLQLAVRNSSSDLTLAKKQAALARRLLLRFNIRLDSRLKKYYCGGCKQLIVPGINGRTRLGHGRTTMLRLTCGECGFVNRRVIARKSEKRGASKV